MSLDCDVHHQFNKFFGGKNNHIVRTILFENIYIYIYIKISY